MKSLWDEAVRKEVKARFERLSDTRPLWGKMNAGEMVTHCANGLHMANGELEVPIKRLPVRYPPLKQLMIYVMKWPQNLPTAPELINRPSVGLEKGVAEIIAGIDAFAGTPANVALPVHPAFGKLSRRAWGVLGYKHLDHHLRQFGV